MFHYFEKYIFKTGTIFTVTTIFSGYR